jgi:hypothetical protein
MLKRTSSWRRLLADRTDAGPDDRTGSLHKSFLCEPIYATQRFIARSSEWVFWLDFARLPPAARHYTSAGGIDHREGWTIENR